MTAASNEVAAVIQAAFWAKVDRRGPDECWPWMGSRTTSGYGLLSTTRATHISLQIDGKPRVGSASALHACDNPICVNPKHLRWGTDADNVADMVARRRHHANRRDKCIHGHALAGANLNIRSNGQRTCRACQAAASRKHKIAKRSAKHG